MKKQAHAETIWKFYQSCQLTNGLEPEWVHPIYRLMRDYAELKGKEKAFANEMIENLELPAGIVVSALPPVPAAIANHPNVRLVAHSAVPMHNQHRIIHDGWKLGSPTWVFMGRALPDSTVYARGEHVVLGRTIPAEFANTVCPAPTSILGPFEPDGRVWIAYSRTEPMGYTAMTANCFGACWGEKDLLYCMKSENC